MYLVVSGFRPLGFWGLGFRVWALQSALHPKQLAVQEGLHKGSPVCPNARMCLAQERSGLQRLQECVSWVLVGWEFRLRFGTSRFSMRAGKPASELQKFMTLRPTL